MRNLANSAISWQFHINVPTIESLQTCRERHLCAYYCSRCKRELLLHAANVSPTHVHADQAAVSLQLQLDALCAHETQSQSQTRSASWLPHSIDYSAAGCESKLGSKHDLVTSTSIINSSRMYLHAQTSWSYKMFLRYCKRQRLQN